MKFPSRQRVEKIGDPFFLPMASSFRDEPKTGKKGWIMFLESRSFLNPS
jgi:hypothetical protein